MQNNAYRKLLNLKLPQNLFCLYFNNLKLDKDFKVIEKC